MTSLTMKDQQHSLFLLCDATGLLVAEVPDVLSTLSAFCSSWSCETSLLHGVSESVNRHERIGTAICRNANPLAPTVSPLPNESSSLLLWRPVVVDDYNCHPRLLSSACHTDHSKSPLPCSIFCSTCTSMAFASSDPFLL